MNSKLCFLLLGATVVALGSSGLHAQTQIGTRHVSFGLTATDTRDAYDTKATGAYFGLNYPVCAGVDLSAGISEYDFDSELVYPDLEGNPVGFNQNGYSVYLGALFYKSVNDYKAYSRVSLSAEQLHLRAGSINDGDTAYFYSVSFGVEWEATANFSCGAFVSYSNNIDDYELGGFDYNPGGAFNAGVFGHLRFTKLIGLEASFAFNDESDIGFSIGTTLTF